MPSFPVAFSVWRIFPFLLFLNWSLVGGFWILPTTSKIVILWANPLGGLLGFYTFSCPLKFSLFAVCGLPDWGTIVSNFGCFGYFLSISAGKFLLVPFLPHRWSELLVFGPFWLFGLRKFQIYPFGQPKLFCFWANLDLIFWPQVRAINAHFYCFWRSWLKLIFGFLPFILL